MSQKTHRLSLQLLITTAFISANAVSFIPVNAVASSTFTTPLATINQDSSYHKGFNKNLNSSVENLTQSSHLKDSLPSVSKLTEKRNADSERFSLPKSSAEKSARAERIMERLRERRINNAQGNVVMPAKPKEFSRAVTKPIHEARPSAQTAKNSGGGRFIYTDQAKSRITTPSAPIASAVTAPVPLGDVFSPVKPNETTAISDGALIAIEPNTIATPIVAAETPAPSLVVPPTYDFPSPSSPSPSSDSTGIYLSSMDAIFGEETMQPIASSHVPAFLQPAPVETLAAPTPTEMIATVAPLQPVTPLQSFAPMAPIAGLSEETKEILYSLPEKITGFTPKREKSGRFAIKRELAAQAALQSSTPSDSSDSMNISVKKRRAVNYDRVLEQAFDALATGNTEAASALYKEVIEAEPKNIDARFGIATTYHRLGMLEKARSEYGFLLHQQPDHLEGLNNFLALVGEESPVEAVKYLIQLAERNTDYSPLWAQVSGIYQNQGDVPSAIEAMERARAITPENIVYSFNLAVLYDEVGQGAKASSFYRTVLLAAERGQSIPVEIADVQNRLTYLSSL